MQLNEEYDLVILSAEKDYNKIKFLYSSTPNLNPQPKNIYIVSPTKINDTIKGVNYVNDQDVLNIERSKIKYRPNWICQQFIKLFQDTTINDKYLVIDSDTFINKEINIFEGGKNNFFISSDQHHHQYFKFMDNFKIKKNFNKSFISEIMLFDKKIINGYLNSINMDKYSFIELSIKLIDDSCYISEFEFYGNMVLENYPNLYDIKHISNSLNGKHTLWGDNEISDLIKRNMGNNIDIISYHTWI